ncbi:cation:proton antiporter [Bailinhaonella thermotolerans]|uniref:Cation:proton antiporter n=2 Tax=Bailinhaonella thermotolerans TaxID=1070861 RepID=A0A3A4B1C3_9ACTN|nr:cation:proton antiporter [Bailinhaonella thermotolerans]
MAVARLARGPSMLDRAVALDAMVAVVMAAVSVEAAVGRHDTTLPTLIVLSVLGFTSSVTVARFASRPDRNAT